MPVEHLGPDASPEQIAKVLERDACVVVDRLAGADRLERVKDELAPYIEATPKSPDDFGGFHTRRTGSLIARSQAAREFVMDPLVLGGIGQVLSHATAIRLHLTQTIAIGPGETAQPIHRDQWAFDFFPFPKDYTVQCNTLWALTDFTEENGATRVIPGSHRFDDKLRLKHEDTEPAEMEAGSALLYTGALYHGGGANQSDAVRIGLNITYAVGWLRQEENQYLAVPIEVARELPEDLLRLMGYSRGSYALGYIGDLLDPMTAVRPEFGKTGFGDAPLQK
jgi:hypothetical protein